MAQIYCLACGYSIDSRDSACSRCGRCPNCRTKAGTAESRCPSCGYPEDEPDIARLERELDPERPSNQREIRWLAAAWERDEAARRISTPKFLALLMFTLLPLTAVLAIGLTAAGLGWFWNALLTMAISFFALRAVFEQVRCGRMPWLLRRGS